MSYNLIEFSKLKKGDKFILPVTDKVTGNLTVNELHGEWRVYTKADGRIKTFNARSFNSYNKDKSEYKLVTPIVLTIPDSELVYKLTDKDLYAN